MTPAQRKRNGRVIALVLAMSTMISLAFLAYAFVQKADAEKAQADFELRIQALESELGMCKIQALAAMEEAGRQQAEAQRSLAAARK